MKKIYWRILFIFITLIQIFTLVATARANGSVNGDEADSVSGMFSLLNNHGVSIPIALSNDLSKIIYVPLISFPPGYSILMALIYKITGNIAVSDFLADCISIILFFITWFFIFELIEPVLGKPARLFIGIFWIFFPAALIAGLYSGHTTELLSVSLLSINVASCIALFKYPRYILFFSILAGLSAGAAASLRTLYTPLIIVTPCALAFMAWRFKENRGKILGAALINLVISSMFVMGVFYHNWLGTGHFIGYIVDNYNIVVTRIPKADTVQWAHLRFMIPFIIFIFGFIYPSSSIRSDEQFIPPFLLEMHVSWVLFIILVATYLYACYTVFFPSFENSADRLNNEENNDIKGMYVFFLSGFLTCFISFVFLLITALTMVPITSIGRFPEGWVAFMTLRYYSPFFPFMFAGVIYVFFKSFVQIKKHCANLLLFFPLASIIILSTIIIGPKAVKSIYNSFLTLNNPPQAERDNMYKLELELAQLIKKFGCAECPIIVHYQEPDHSMQGLAYISGFTVLVSEQNDDADSLGNQLKSEFYTNAPVNIIFSRNTDMEEFIIRSFSNTPNFLDTLKCIRNDLLCLYVMPPSK